nr:hypothetical protein CFP56_57612 [Quercus suber]
MMLSSGVRSHSTASAARISHFTVFSILLSFSSLVSADVNFTIPAAGASVPAGTIDVAWQDSGIVPSLQDLTQYTLDLMVGGNGAGQMLPLTTFVSQGTFGAAGKDGQARGTIPAGIASEVDNGFFFRMTSTVATGGIVVNYSHRFSIANLTGKTPVQYREAAAALQGSTDGPDTIGNGIVVSLTSSSASSTPSSTTLSGSSVATATTTSTPITSTTPQTTSTSVSTSTPASTSAAALSLGAKTGIIVAIAAFFLLTSGIALFFLIRRHRRTRAGGAPQGRNPFLDDKAELPAFEHEMKPRSSHSNISELYAGSEVFEADDGARRPELDHMTFRAELPG